MDLLTAYVGSHNLFSVVSNRVSIIVMETLIFIRFCAFRA